MVGFPRRIFTPTILLLIGAVAWCQSFDELARGLAQKMSNVLKLQSVEKVSLSFHDVSPLSPPDAAAARAAIERELRALGVNTVEAAQGDAELTVTLSENLHEWAWVAEIRRKSGLEPAATEVVIEKRPKPVIAAGEPSIVLEKKLMLEQDERILDVAPLGRALLVLDGEAVSVYETSGGAWQRKLFVRIPVSQPWPRDLRGRIVAQASPQTDAYQAYLPGMTCHGNAGGGLSISCRDESLWPMGSGPRMLGIAQFAPSRNYFDGRVVTPNGSQTTLPAFFSAAQFTVRENAAWALAGVDGRTYLYNTPIQNSGAWTGLGVSITGVESDCGARSQVLATASGDDTVADIVQAYDIIDGAPRTVGEAVRFPGPVTALWPAAERGVAFAVSRDLRTGRYVAFRLAINCTQ
jgi:hypothetical protein